MTHHPLKAPSRLNLAREALVGLDMLGLPRALFDASRTAVAAFAGYEFMQEAYQVAIKEKYRLFSFGDAMLIL